MEWWNAVLPVVTLVIGYVGTLVTEAARGSRDRRIAKEDREDALSVAHAAERRAFELQTLTDLKAALADLGRAAGRAHHFDLMAARENGSATMPSTQLPEDVNAALFDTNGRVQSLVGLVMDEAARTKVSEFTSAVARLGATSRPETQAERELLAAVELLEEAQRLLSERIRSIYGGQASNS
ncbi:hypothetical protein [Nocardioides sp. zg-1230]|uniref:hypothetical protein n=1 Tax=Nocardioides sp. zg-1230 TaxID=2736601 RepID=UPI001556E98D|nr:hypothetical protein [Nocardioides sp. zg-1230]NPC42944.1 hypothetical protein [Nocardioides sp. zg-1230]